MMLAVQMQASVQQQMQQMDRRLKSLETLLVEVKEKGKKFNKTYVT